MLRTRPRSHDMILIDELHRNGSLGVGQGLFGGLQIGAHPTLLTLQSVSLSGRQIVYVCTASRDVSRHYVANVRDLVQAALQSTTTARKSCRTASCPRL